MTAPGQYGSYTYQSPETRALASITAESYDKDQAKTIIKLKNDVGYMSAYMRKMQKSIDQANANFIQQIQAFIADFIVLLGGGSLTTIDFGDLRYVIQAIGALLGFQSVGGIPVPINLFTAAWNFFGIYIAPTAQFADIINQFIDAGFAIILDVVGEIPVFGNAVQQLAAWLMEIRDALWPLVDTVFLLIDTLSGQPGTEPEDVMLGLFGQVIDLLLTTPDVLLDVTTSVVDLLVDTPQILLNLLNGLIAMLIESPQLIVDLTNKIVDTILTFPAILDQLVNGVLNLILTVPNYLYELLNSLINLIVTVPEILVTLLTGLITLLIESPGILWDLTEALIGLLIISPEILTELGEALIASGAKLLGIESPLNSLNLFNSVPTDLLAQIDISHVGTAITNLIADPNFLDVEGFTGGGEWLQDLTGGIDGLGTAYTTADGTTRELLTTNPIPVSKDQVLPISAFTKWTGLAGSGNPVQLGVTGYVTGSDVTHQTILAQHNTIPPTTDWLQLAGNYVVPADVSAIRVNLIVSSAATAGTVYWSKLSATKTGTLLQRLISGTDPGTFLPDDIENLFTGTVTNAMELVNKAGLSDFNDLASTLAGQATQGFQDVENRMNSFLDSLSTLNASNINAGAIADQFVPGIHSVIDTSVSNILNIPAGGGFDYPDLGDAFSAQASALTDAGAQVTNLMSKFLHLESRVNSLPTPTGPTTPGTGTAYGGVNPLNDTDDFERTSSSSIGSQWITSYSGGSGTWATPNGHDASFAVSGIANRDFLCIRNNSAIPRSATDYQRVTKVLSSKATRYYDLILGTFNYTGHNDIWLRISDSSTTLANVTGIRIRFGGDGSVSVVRFLNGSPTTLLSYGPGTISPPGPGGQIVGEAGSLGNGTLRYFRGLVGASTRIELTEVGVASGAGAAYRRWGHGGRAEGHTLPLPGQQKPGSLHYWNGTDQTSGLS